MKVNAQFTLPFKCVVPSIVWWNRNPINSLMCKCESTNNFFFICLYYLYTIYFYTYRKCEYESEYSTCYTTDNDNDDPSNSWIHACMRIFVRCTCNVHNTTFVCWVESFVNFVGLWQKCECCNKALARTYTHTHTVCIKPFTEAARETSQTPALTRKLEFDG